MTLTQLEYIIAVDTFRHFGKASKSCHVTQPTLSAQVQKLEDELQVALFERTKNQVKTTELGRLIVDQAKKVLHERKQLLDLVESLGDDVAGSLRLAIIPTLSPFLLPLFLKPFIENYPKVSVEVLESITEEIVQKIKDDELDAGLLVTPLEDKSLKTISLYMEPFYLFVAPTHPFYEKKEVHEDELQLDDIWLLNKGNCFRDQVLSICQSKKTRPKERIYFESGNFETLKNMVLQAGGYTILPQMALDHLPDEQKKYVRPLSKPVPSREISLVFSKDSKKVKIFEALEEEILKNLTEEILVPEQDLNKIDIKL